MNIEDKLPKAEDVLAQVLNERVEDLDEIFNTQKMTEAMHEYARRLIDVARRSVWNVENVERNDTKFRMDIEAEILKLKEMLK